MTHDDEELGHLFAQAINGLPGGQLDAERARAGLRRRRRRQHVLGGGVLAAAVAAAALIVPALQPGPIVAEPATSPTSAAVAAPTLVAAPSPRQPAGGATASSLSAAQSEAVIERCRADLGPVPAVDHIDLAINAPVAGPAVLFTDKDGTSYVCDDYGSTSYDGPAAKNRAAVRPSRAAPAIRVRGGRVTSDTTGTSTDGPRQAVATTAYRVASSVSRVQVRIRAGDETGPWFDADVRGGYAYGWAAIDSVTTRTGGSTSDRGSFVVEDRAFDRAGKQVAIVRAPR